jgi:hypothetical protein
MEWKKHTGRERVLTWIYIFLRVLLYEFNKKFWEELTAYFSLILHGAHKKQNSRAGYTDTQQCDPSRLLTNIGGGGDTERQQGDLIRLPFPSK